MWAIYGATGFTGRLIAREAIARGHTPLLLGRSATRLGEIARELNLEFRVVTQPGLAEQLRDIDLLINVAGPFSETTKMVLAACIESRTHYLDVANELDSVQQVFDQSDRVAAAEIMAIPSVGFGTVSTDAVAQRAVDERPGAVSLEIAMFADNDSGGPATNASVFEVLAQGGVRLVGGEIERMTLGRGIRRIQTPLGTRSIVPVATGDLVTASRTTGVSTVAASVGFAVPGVLLRIALPLVSLIARSGLLRASKPRSTKAKPATPRVFRSATWARATDASGASTTAWLETGEGYAFTAASAVSAAEAVLAAPAVGVSTIASAFGADFALRIPGTSIVLLDEEGMAYASSQP